MTVEDFEARVDIAHRATTQEELRALLADLPTGNLPVTAGQGGDAVTGVASYPIGAREHTKENGYAVAVLGGARRGGRWRPARATHVLAVMGGVDLDFREAVLPPGVTEVRIYTVMGGVEVLVPPGLNVESHGIGIMGAFEHTGADSMRPDPTAPTLRVSGIAVMGGVDIKVRHVGESARDARRRSRKERRALRRKEIRSGAKEIRSRVKEFSDDFKRLGE
jgi:hypothetical protein